MRRVTVLLLVIFISISTAYPTSREDIAQKKIKWTMKDSKAYAQNKVIEWGDNQWKCLEKLWTRESRWNHKAYNKVKVMGRNAGGIPQILGLSPDLHPINQIDRGVEYVIYRYGTFCQAWKFHQKNGWY